MHAFTVAATMEGSSLSPLLLLCITLSALALALYLLGSSHGRGRKPQKPPPGPPTVPFLVKFFALRRHIFDLSPLLRDLHARHGPVISIRLFRRLVLVADRHVAHRALVQSGTLLADRPPDFQPNVLFNHGAINTASYGPYWRLLRRNFAAEAMGRARIGLLAPARRWVGDGLVADLLGAAQGGEAVAVRPVVRRAMFELLVYMCLGVRLGRSELDELNELQHETHRSVASFPVFTFLPALTTRLFRGRWAALLAVRRRQEEMFVPLIHAARRGDEARACYANSLLAVRVPYEGDRPLADGEMVSLCSEFLNAGTDTTVTLIEWIMAELATRPDIQARIHEEVKANPELNDADLQGMPYLKAVVMEGLRLHPPGHFVLNHCLQSDADIGGYAVPKGAEVNFMVREIGHDAAVWTAPREFRPERFLEGGEGCDVDVTGSREIKMMPFGAGRRMCPGYTVGMHHAEYFVARIVREMEWRPETEGEPIDKSEVYNFLSVMKNPLRVRITARKE